MTIETIGDRIRQELTRTKTEPKDLAKFTGMAYSTLMGLINNAQSSSTKLHKIAEFFNVQASWLESGRGPKFAMMLREPSPTYIEARCATEAS